MGLDYFAAFKRLFRSVILCSLFQVSASSAHTACIFENLHTVDHNLHCLTNITVTSAFIPNVILCFPVDRVCYHCLLVFSATDLLFWFWQKQKSREWAQLRHGHPEAGHKESVVQEDEHAGGGPGLPDPSQHAAAEAESSSPEASRESEAEGRVVCGGRGGG